MGKEKLTIAISMLVFGFFMGALSVYLVHQHQNIIVKLRESDLEDDVIYTIEKKEFVIVNEIKGRYMTPRILSDFKGDYFREKQDELYEKLKGKHFIRKDGGYIVVEQW